MTDSVYLLQGTARADIESIMLDTRPEDVVPGLVWDAQEKQKLYDLLRDQFSSSARPTGDNPDWREDQQRSNDGINGSFLCINLPNLVPKTENLVQIAENLSSVEPGDNQMRGLNNNRASVNHVSVLIKANQKRRLIHFNTSGLPQQIVIHRGENKNLANQSSKKSSNHKTTPSKDNAVNSDTGQSITTQRSDKSRTYPGSIKVVKIKRKLNETNKKKRITNSAKHSEIGKKAVAKPDLVDEGVNSGRKLYSCSVCDQAFNCLWSLGYHMWSHTKLFTCPDCNKRFKNNKQLQSHIRIHAGAKVFCPLCSREFSCKAYLNKHIKRMHKQN